MRTIRLLLLLVTTQVRLTAIARRRAQLIAELTAAGADRDNLVRLRDYR